MFKQRNKIIPSLLLLLLLSSLPTYANAVPSLPDDLNRGIAAEATSSVSPESRSVLLDGVLDTYMSFYCYVNPAHNRREFNQTYKRLYFGHSYTRLNKDLIIGSMNGYPCPVDPSHGGDCYDLKCQYRVW